MSDLIKREDAIKAIHNYWKKRLDTLPTKESEYGEVYADIQQMDKILEHNKILCNFINAIPSADRPQGEWIYGEHNVAMCDGYRCNRCDFFVPWDYEHKFIDFINDYHYCPSCGARMKGADDE